MGLLLQGEVYRDLSWNRITQQEEELCLLMLLMGESGEKTGSSKKPWPGPSSN